MLGPSENPVSRSPSGRRFAHALALLCVFAAEFALFWVSTERHYAWIYPRWFDQQQYLSEAYATYDQVRSHGVASGVHQALARGSPQGVLHALYALAVFVFAGPSRTAALSVNLLALLGLQGVTFLAIRRLSGSWALAWASVALLAALQGPWSGLSASTSDFRLDWMAACAFGATLGIALAGDGFRSTRWAALLGVAVGLTLLTRHLTAVYMGLIYFCLILWFLRQPGRLERCGRILLSAAIALAMSGWAFWRSRRAIYGYYWVGHFGDREGDLRSSHLGLASSISWMARELLGHQVGLAALCMGAGVAIALVASARLAARRGMGGGSADGPTRDAWATAVIFLAVPAGVLLFHPEKSHAPLEVLIPAVVWIILLSWIRASRGAGRAAVVSACAVACVGGAAVFAGSQLRSPYSASKESGYRSVNALGDFLFFRAEESNLVQPRVAVTWWLDGLNAESFELMSRERHGRQLRFIPMLPTGLFEVEPTALMDRLAGSDFVCLVTRATAGWPFDRQMPSMLPEMRSWCESHMKRDGSLETEEFSATIYEREDLEKPREGRGVDLAALVSAAGQGLAYAPAGPPEAPLVGDPGPVLWTTRADFSYVARAAYSRLHFQAVDIPPALTLNPDTGEITGRFLRAGQYSATLAAVNARGSATAKLVFQVSDEAWGAEIRPPLKAAVGVPARIDFSVFDPAGTLNFIDVTDLGVPKVLARLAANDDQRKIWQGAYAPTFREAGAHTVLLRFVRFNPAGAGTYTFMDRQCTIDVGP